MRPDTPDMPASHPSRRQLIVASACAQMERSILQGRMKAALAHAERVVAELEATRRMAA
jgi:DNA invertase Pin-like site-specific DNA recombinase